MKLWGAGSQEISKWGSSCKKIGLCNLNCVQNVWVQGSIFVENVEVGSVKKSITSHF